jgi:hypothetical protein
MATMVVYVMGDVHCPGQGEGATGEELHEMESDPSARPLAVSAVPREQGGR